MKINTDSYPSNEQLIANRNKHYLPSTTHYYHEPLQLVKAEGSYVWDNLGRRFFDAIGGIACISAGHNHPKIKKALIEMLEKNEIQHTTTLYLNRNTAHLAELLIKHAPEGIDRCHFTNSGSEANEAAFLAARNATGETMIINLRYGYHGGTAATLAQCGQSSWRFRAQPVASATSALEPNCYRCPFGQKKESCDLECAKNVETTIQTSTHGKIAAFVAEPILGVGGFIDPPKEYFQEVIKIVHNYGGKYISDEVQTGVGRCGESLFETKELGIQADIISMAKGLGNGAAIGAVLMRSDVAEHMAGKSFFNTFGGDSFQTKQAALTVEIIEEEKLIQNAKAMGALLKDGLKELMKKYALIGDVRGRGLLLGFELVKDRKTKEPAAAETLQVLEQCKAKGLLVGRGGLKKNVVRMAPALSITRDDVSFILKTFDESLREICV